MPISVTTGYQHTLANLRTMVRRMVMKPTSDDRWDDDLVDDCINRALDELHMLGIEQIATDTFTSSASQQEWTPEATVWRVLGVNYDDKWLTMITKDEMDRITGGDWDANSGDPSYWFVEHTDAGCHIWFDKKMPTGKTVKFWFEKRIQDLSDDDTLCGFYKTFTPLIVYKACALLKHADGDLQESQGWDLRFDRLFPMAEYRSLNPGGGNLTPHDPHGWSDPN